MPLFRRHGPAVNAHTSLGPPSYGGPQRARSVRPKSKIAALLKRQLAICAARVDTGEFEVLDVGLVVQVHVIHNDSYVDWRAHWDRRFNSIPKRGLGTATWPAALPEGGWSVLVVPVKPGTATLTAALPPRTALKGVLGTPTGRARNLVPALIASPLVGHTTTPTRGATPELMGMDTICGWLEWIPDDTAPRLAPPVFEHVRANDREVLKRVVITWDLPWPLPAPSLPPLRRPSLERSPAHRSDDGGG